MFADALSKAKNIREEQAKHVARLGKKRRADEDGGTLPGAAQPTAAAGTAPRTPPAAPASREPQA
eukprot:8847229-Pyramimonas_sp.AAC.1